MTFYKPLSYGPLLTVTFTTAAATEVNYNYG